MNLYGIGAGRSRIWNQILDSKSLLNNGVSTSGIIRKKWLKCNSLQVHDTVWAKNLCRLPWNTLACSCAAGLCSRIENEGVHYWENLWTCSPLLSHPGSCYLNRNEKPEYEALGIFTRSSLGPEGGINSSSIRPVIWSKDWEVCAMPPVL